MDTLREFEPQEGAMTRRRRFLALAAALIALPGATFAQSRSDGAPPIPTGPPLEPPPAETRRPTWLEDGPTVIPASGTSGPRVIAGEDTAWPVTHAGSACNFDAPDPHVGWLFSEPTSVQVLFGTYYSSKLGPGISTFNYLPLTIRHGWDLGNPAGPTSPVPGNWEALLDFTGAAITSSYGNWFAGTSLLFRYNWTDPGSTLIPYCQGGPGIILNDAYRDRDPRQRAIGQMLEFYLHAEVGLRWLVAPNLSVDIEGGLQHISNACLAPRNAGVNAVGGSVGFTYYFPWGAQ
jgi:hypothetical protein